MAQVLTSVAAGEKVRMYQMVDGDRELVEVTVAPYHPNGPDDEGHWYCVTHHMHFQNQLQKDLHIHDTSHKLAWICHEHGIEQPCANPQPQVIRD